MPKNLTLMAEMNEYIFNSGRNIVSLPLKSALDAVQNCNSLSRDEYHEKIVYAVAGIAALAMMGSANAGTLEDVKARGVELHRIHRYTWFFEP